MTKNGTMQELTGVYRSPLGDIVLTSDGSALTGLRFAESPCGELAQDIPLLADACRWLNLYFGGTKPDFTPQLAPIGTPFQQSVWRELLTIPYGQTVSSGSGRCRRTQPHRADYPLPPRDWFRRPPDRLRLRPRPKEMAVVARGAELNPNRLLTTCLSTHPLRSLLIGNPMQTSMPVTSNRKKLSK